MKRFCVVVPWPEGLHLRPAAKLVRVAQRFRSTLSLKCGERVADLQSILSIITLCATLGTVLEVEVRGIDELVAARAVEDVFSTDDGMDYSGDLITQESVSEREDLGRE